MPNIKSAIKRVKVAERRRLRNRAVRSAVRTYVKTAEKSILSTSADEAISRAAVAKALKELDSAASKGVIHKNNAARRKSRLVKKFNQLQAEG